jgi:drug/metabolite transporter (DMT)-like permease
MTLDTRDWLAIAGTVLLVAGFAAIWLPLGAIVAGCIMLAAAVMWAAYNVRARGPGA